MRRNITTIGLALVAVLAMGSFLAAGAQGSSLTASSYPAVFTGEQATKHVFTFQGNKVECTKAHFEGSLGAASGSFTVTPTYTGCTMFGIANGEVSMNGCVYEEKITETTTSPTHFWDGTTHLRCPPGATTTFSAPSSSPLCIVHVPEQTPTTNKIDLENIGANTVRVTYTVSGWHANITDIGGFFCPLSNASTDTTGSYTGTVDLKGTEGKTISVS